MADAYGRNSEQSYMRWPMQPHVPTVQPGLDAFSTKAERISTPGWTLFRRAVEMIFSTYGAIGSLEGRGLTMEV